MTINKPRKAIIGLVLLSVILLGFNPLQMADSQGVKFVIIMIGDGMGANHLQAANLYTGTQPEYQNWTKYWVSTYAADGSYQPQQYWSDFEYALSGYTDSAAAATALLSGLKTANGRISVNFDGSQRLETIADLARASGKALGAVTSVYLSHATPGAWFAHNLHRSNGYAIADEGLWGNPNTTGEPDQPYYAGGQGTSYPSLDVVIGAGHPDWQGGNYINQTMLTKLRMEDALRDEFILIERVPGMQDAGSRLMNAASDPSISRLVGLFGGVDGNLEYRLADGSGDEPENPTLAQMTTAALNVVSRNTEGFALLVEGGAIDWASHANDMDGVIGEMIAFNQAAASAIQWVEDTSNGSSWSNTIIVVTADHETGHLTAAPGEYPDQPLGRVDSHTLSLEKELAGSGLRASWEDADGDAHIDIGEHIYWAWNSTGHSNSLVPLYVMGPGALEFSNYIQGIDPVRGEYVDNTAVFKVIREMMEYYAGPTPSPTQQPGEIRSYIPFIWR